MKIEDDTCLVTKRMTEESSKVISVLELFLRV